MDSKGETLGLYQFTSFSDLGYIYKCLSLDNDKIVEIDDNQKLQQTEDDIINQQKCRQIAQKEGLNWYNLIGSKRPYGCSRVYKNGKPTSVVYYHEKKKKRIKEECNKGYGGYINLIYLDEESIKTDEQFLNTLLHEIGHFLGLKHPFSPRKGLDCKNNEYTTDHTIMSYCPGKMLLIALEKQILKL
jgi:hypothetical protein